MIRALVRSCVFGWDTDAAVAEFMGSISLFACLVLLAAPGQLHGTEASGQPSDGPTPEHYLALYQAGRERIYAGVFTADEFISVDIPNQGRRNSRVAYKVAFDFAKQLFRFDFRIDGDNPSAAQYISRPDGDLIATADGQVVSRRAPRDYPKGLACHPFDVRLLGTVDFLMQFSKSLTFDDQMAGCRRMIANGEVSSHVEDLDGQKLVRCRFEMSGKSRMATDWILDPHRDFVPIRWESRNADADGALLPTATMSSRFECIDDVWVPTSITYAAAFSGNPQISLEIKWDKLNQPVDETFFTIEGLRLAESAWIADERQVPTIVEGKVGAEPAVHTAPQPVRRRSIYVILAVANALLLLMGLLWAGMRSRIGRPPA